MQFIMKYKLKEVSMQNINGINLLEMKDIAEKLKLSLPTVCKYLKEGRIKAQKIGQSWFVTEENLERFIRGE
jgi:excisionase family DNA binding protein